MFDRVALLARADGFTQLASLSSEYRHLRWRPTKKPPAAAGRDPPMMDDGISERGEGTMNTIINNFKYVISNV
jgi:hypothetical protein